MTLSLVLTLAIAVIVLVLLAWTLVLAWPALRERTARPVRSPPPRRRAPPARGRVAVDVAGRLPEGLARAVADAHAALAPDRVVLFWPDRRGTLRVAAGVGVADHSLGSAVLPADLEPLRSGAPQRLGLRTRTVPGLQGMREAVGLVVRHGAAEGLLVAASAGERTLRPADRTRLRAAAAA
jgi:hypothetical protein